MILLHLRGALRNLRRNKFYSLINIGCLAIGLAVCMTIMLYVLHEHSYDRWQAHADRTFSTWGTFHFGNSEYHSAALSYQAGPLLRKGDANVEGFLRIWKAYREPGVQKLSMSGEMISGNGPLL